MFSGFLQSMGTASKLIRLMILILVGIITWKMWYHVFPSSASMPPPIQVIGLPVKNDGIGLKGLPQQTERLEITVSSPLRVAVYYEALCPDSKHFISHQLLPAYKALSDIFTVDLVPYGKATSRVAEDGRITFKCQHGQPECKANMVHACVAKHVSDEKRRLDLVKCMIEANSMKTDPFEVGRKCVSQYKEEDWGVIDKCSHGKEGEELLYHLGKMTHDLSPKVTFIPAITINDSQENQPLILRSLKKAICAVYSGPKHSACDT